MIIPRELNIKYKEYIGKVSINEISLLLLESDYVSGFVNRYFCKNNLIKSSQILEINFDTYNNLLTKNSMYPHEYYTITSVIWKLTGKLVDNSIGGDSVIHGVRDTNKRSVIEANKILNGIDRKLFNFIEFARINK